MIRLHYPSLRPYGTLTKTIQEPKVHRTYSYALYDDIGRTMRTGHITATNLSSAEHKLQELASSAEASSSALLN